MRHEHSGWDRTLRRFHLRRQLVQSSPRNSVGSLPEFITLVCNLSHRLTMSPYADQASLSTPRGRFCANPLCARTIASVYALSITVPRSSTMSIGAIVETTKGKRDTDIAEANFESKISDCRQSDLEVGCCCSACPRRSSSNRHCQ